MSIGIYLAVCAVLLIASTVQASSGFGQGLIAAPLLRLLEPALLPGPIVFVGFVTSIGVALRNSQRREFRRVVPALGGRVVGNVLALGLLATLNERGLTIAIGVIVLGFVISRIVGIGLPLTARTLTGAGVVSGVGGTIAALGGAPMALLYQQHADARDFRGPLGWYTVVGSGLSVLTLVVFGTYDSETIVNSLLLLPPIAGGWFAARWVTPILDRGDLRPLVLGLSGGAALVLIVSELV